MKIDENGNVTFTRNEAFILINGVHGLSNPRNEGEVIAASMVGRHLGPELKKAGFGPHVVAAAEDIGLNHGDVGIFNDK